MPVAQETAKAKKPPALPKIPAFPPIAIRLLQVLANENVGISEILEPLRADPAFSAEILRRANSALFGFSSQINSLQHALVVLGLRRVRTLTMTVATGIYLKKALEIEGLRTCWRHTLACALLTEDLARASLMHLDVAYTAGLLHDVGRLGLLVAHPAQYSDFLRTAGEKAASPEPFDLLDYEKQVFGIDHCEAGNWLAGQWMLPQEFAVVTGRHHDRPSGQETDLLALVYWGCQLANTLGFYVVDTGHFLGFEDIRGALPEAARRRFPDDRDALRELVEKRIRSLDLPADAPALPTAEEAAPQQQTWTEASPAAPELPEPEAAAEPSPSSSQVSPPPRSTLRRDLVAAVVTLLVAGTAFFFILRALAE